MELLVIGYFVTGAVVAAMIYAVNSQIRRINGPSIQDRLFQIGLSSCPLEDRWLMPLVTGVAYTLVAVGVAVGWPCALAVNIRKWAKYKHPMSDDEYKAALREIRLMVQSASPMGPGEIKAEREELRLQVLRSKNAEN